MSSRAIARRLPSQPGSTKLAEECWISTICNNQPSWTRLSNDCETNCKNDINEVQQYVTRIEGELNSLREKFSHLTNSHEIPEVKQTSSTQSMNSSTSPFINAPTGPPRQTTVKEAFLSYITNTTDDDVTPSKTTGNNDNVAVSAVAVTTEGPLPQTTVEESFISHITNATGDDVTPSQATGNTNDVTVFEDTLTTEGNCDITYDSTCFTAIVYDVWNVSYNDGETLCNETNGKPANIYDVTHYRLMQDYLRQKMKDNGWTGIEVWTGMRYENNQLKLRSGENYFLPAEVWRLDYPKDVAGWKNIVVKVNINPNITYQGIGNDHPSWKCYGVICEK